jgi:hypothetical protein
VSPIIHTRNRKVRETVFAYVYTGSKPPAYFIAAMRNTKRLFPTSRVCLLTDNRQLLPASKMTGIEVIEVTQEGLMLDDTFSERNASFRQGFWVHTTTRLLHLNQLVKHVSPDGHVIHLEGDMLVLPDFPLEALAERRQPSWMALEDDQDMPGLISIRCSDIPDLVQRISRILESEPNLNDMQILHKIRTIQPDRIQLLPSLPYSRLEGNVGLESTRGTPILFDPAYYAQWFIGEDPRNAWGLVRRKRQLRKFINLGNYRLAKNQANGLTLASNREEFDLATLHVHSKEARFFANGNNVELLVERGKMKRDFFSIQGATRSIQDAIRHGLRRIERWIKSK